MNKGYNKITIPAPGFLAKKGSFLMIKSNVTLLLDPDLIVDPQLPDVQLITSGGGGGSCSATALSAQRIAFNFEYAPSIQYPVSVSYDVPDVYVS